MYEDRIERGAAWLDENKPGWERLIDVSTLDLSQCNMCVLGQAFMEEGRATQQWGFIWVCESSDFQLNTTEMGFAFRDETLDMTASQRKEAWTALTDEWGLFIKARFDSGMLSDSEVA